ncbi:hypothetical protein F5Y03DRAFT_179790 [Xylaria venustula]|nr:hypothetical protein F5Y03DRAFT_179790 [Xylaria venustula]
MCKRIFTHRMHHSVAAPMILDPVGLNPVVYANPLRTNFHRCELSSPPPEWLLNSSFHRCPYHTCCVPDVEVEYCADLLAYLDREGEEFEFNPEECDAFILEHQHERLPYFGNEGAYLQEVPATWGKLAKLQADNSDAIAGFAHKTRYFAKWVEKLFLECEKLHTLTQDAATLSNSMQDLMNYNPVCSKSKIEAMRVDILEAQGNLQVQKELVFDLSQWATTSCDPCFHTEGQWFV